MPAALRLHAESSCTPDSSIGASRYRPAAVAFGTEHALKPAEPVVAAVFPIAAEILVGHVHGDDVLGVLEAELGRDADLLREAVLSRQCLVQELEGHLGLRMQRGRHVDRVGVALRALEPDVFGARVGADALEEIGQPRAGPRADRAPALDADV